MTGLRALLYIILLSFSVSCASAQPAGKSTKSSSFNKKETKLIAEARSAMDAGNFTDAIPLLDALINKHPNATDLIYLRGLGQKRLTNYQGAITDFSRGYAQDQNPRAQLELGEAYALNAQFDLSVQAYEAYLSAVRDSRRPGQKEKAERLLTEAREAAAIARNPVSFSPSPLSGGINSDEHLEYFPSLSIDGQRMIFTRRVNGENEDFYVSDRKEDGSWASALPLESINTGYDEGAQSITADGNFLVFTVCNRPEGAGSCDLVFSVKEEGRWTNPQFFGPAINTEAYEAQPSISPDGLLLFFTSTRAGGQGQEDLYVSGRLPEGGWSKPANLGGGINTSGKDQYPFWSSDGKTLFFTSDGHPGMGGEDLFRTALGSDNTWSAPTNLGYPINTPANETNLFIGLNGRTAYFSKREIDPTTGASDVDIYQFELPEEIRPAPTTYLEARVIDAISREPLMATARLRPVTGAGAEKVLATDQEGKFLSLLPSGQDYALTVEQEGYLFYSDRFSLAGGLLTDEPFRLTVELQPITEVITESNSSEEDGSTAFKNVLFETGSATLLPVSGQELDRLLELLTKAGQLRVQIAGHTDDIGTEADNLRLSEQRAIAVRQYLIDGGIDASRISTLGYGENRPVTSNDTEAGRAKNRRTTFRLRE